MQLCTTAFNALVVDSNAKACRLYLCLQLALCLNFHHACQVNKVNFLLLLVQVVSLAMGLHRKHLSLAAQKGVCRQRFPVGKDCSHAVCFGQIGSGRLSAASA